MICLLRDKVSSLDLKVEDRIPSFDYLQNSHVYHATDILRMNTKAGLISTVLLCSAQILASAACAGYTASLGTERSSSIR